MLKSKVFKKIAALTAAIALVGSFAASASAALSVDKTTTKYTNDGKVAVTVTGSADANDMVTYYLEDEATDTVVHLDQTAANDAGAFTFTTYVTDASNLKATATVADDAETTDAVLAVDTISGAANANGKTLAVVKGYDEIPTEETSTTVNFTVSDLSANETVTGVKVTSGNATAGEVSENSGVYSVTLTITGEGNITLAPEVEESIVNTPSGRFIAAGMLAGTNGGSKITVLGKVENVTGEFGAYIGTADWKTIETTPGYFAVQVDFSDYTETSYNVGIYYYDGETRKPVTGKTVSIAQ